MLRQLAYSAAARVNPGQDRRARGRVRQQGVTSNLGVVIDLSGGGVRILSTTGFEGKQNVTISCDTDAVDVKAEVVWCRRVGFRRFLVGMKFVELDESGAKIVGRIASTHRLEVAV